MEPSVNALAYDQEATGILQRVARSQFKRRRRAYEELSLFTDEDLSQELWVRLLIEEKRGRLASVFASSEEAFAEYLTSLAEGEAIKGRRKAKQGRSIPMSRLTRQDKAKLWHKRGFSLEATFDEIFERQEHWG